MHDRIAICDFQVIRPEFESSQEESLAWVAAAHVEADKSAGPLAELQERLYKIGLGPEKIKKRGIVFDDFFHRSWEKMQIYRLDLAAEGLSLKERSLLFEQAADRIFEAFYPSDSPLPSHMIHVTCTGYVAPSPAQKLVASRGSLTTVTHAYHMGCYASVPALRIGSGYLLSSSDDESVDVVHTEICSLHMNPMLHEMGQLVVQSLFADGFIKYRLTRSEDAGSSALRILALHEEIIPDTSDKMSWKCEPWGFKMTIAKEVPVLIARSLEGFLKRLAEKAQVNLEELLSNGWFAIHPGGPKIIQQVGEKLRLEEQQLKHSKTVLFEMGNMSSATLPHIWEKMIADPEVENGAFIVSLAFGPGLTFSGAIFKKEG